MRLNGCETILLYRGVSQPFTVKAVQYEISLDYMHWLNIAATHRIAAFCRIRVFDFLVGEMIICL